MVSSNDDLAEFFRMFYHNILFIEVYRALDLSSEETNEEGERQQLGQVLRWN
jgi:hypothetical protein